MERIFTAGAKVGAALQEWDRLAGEEAAFEMLTTKHDTLGEPEAVDTCLDGLRNIKKHKEALSTLIRNAFGRTAEELRPYSYQLRVAAEQHETITMDLIRVQRTLEILAAAQAFGNEGELSRDELLTTQAVLLLQEQASLENIKTLVAPPQVT